MALLLEDVVEHINNKRPTYNIRVNGWPLYGIVKRGVNVTCTGTDNSKINVFLLFMKRIDGLLNLFQVGNVCFSRDSFGRIFQT